MGQVGVCWSNAVAVNFFSHLKAEFPHHESLGTRPEARTAVMGFIEVWNNRKRPNEPTRFRAPATAWTKYTEDGRSNMAT